MNCVAGLDWVRLLWTCPFAQVTRGLLRAASCQMTFQTNIRQSAFLFRDFARSHPSHIHTIPRTHMLETACAREADINARTALSPTLILGSVTVGGFALARKLTVSRFRIRLSTWRMRGRLESDGSTKSALSASISTITSLPNTAALPEKQAHLSVLSRTSRMSQCSTRARLNDAHSWNCQQEDLSVLTRASEMPRVSCDLPRGGTVSHVS